MSENKEYRIGPYMVSWRLPSDAIGGIAAARLALAQVTAVRGSAGALAEACGVSPVYLAQVKRGAFVPSAAFCNALEERVGIPSAWWGTRPAELRMRALEDAAKGAGGAQLDDARACLAAWVDRQPGEPMMPWPWVRLAMTKEGLADVLRGRAMPNAQQIAIIEEKAGIDPKWWQVQQLQQG